MTHAILLAALILSAPARPAPVPLVYWLAECNAWPLTRAQLADDGIRVESVHAKAGRVSVHLRRRSTRQRASLEAIRLGSREAGWSVWSVRGPVSIRRAMNASPACRVVATYRQARDWPAAAKTWLLRRATCYGVSNWRGRAYTVWPCKWTEERAGDGAVTQLDGFGPGVLNGGSGRTAAGVTDDD